MLALFALGLAVAGDLPDRPEAGDVVEDQCEKVYPMHKNRFLPADILGPDGKPDCFAIIVPLSDYSDLLMTETWATTIAQQYRVDTGELEANLNWYKEKLEEETQPLPFFDRPETQRWLGRIETLVTVGIVAVGLSAAYSYGAGATR